MKCSVCGALNPKDSKACVVCGRDLPLINLDDIVSELTSDNVVKPVQEEITQGSNGAWVNEHFTSNDATFDRESINNFNYETSGVQNDFLSNQLDSNPINEEPAARSYFTNNEGSYNNPSSNSMEGNGFNPQTGNVQNDFSSNQVGSNSINEEPAPGSYFTNNETSYNNPSSSNLEGSGIQNDFSSNKATSSPVNEPPKNKGKAPLIIGLIIALIVITVALLGTFIMLNRSPKRIFDSSINKVFNALETSLNNDYETEKTKVNMNAKLISNDEELTEYASLIEGFDLILNMGVDYKNLKLNYDVKVNYEDKEFVNVNAVYDKKAYLIFKNILDKPIESECDDCESILKRENFKEINTVLQSVNTAVKGSLSKDYFSSEKRDVIINGKNVKTTANTLRLNAKEQVIFNNEVIDKLLKDDEFIKAASKLMDSEKSGVKQRLKNSKKELSDVNADEEIEIILYTKGIKNEFVKLDVKTSMYDFSISGGKQKDSYELAIKSGGISMILNVNYSVAYDEKITMPDVSGAVRESDVTEEEAIGLFNNLMNQEGFKAFDEDFKMLTGMSIQESFMGTLEGNALSMPPMY